MTKAMLAVRLCILGVDAADAAWLARVAREADGARVEPVAGTASEALGAAARAWPGEHLILLRAGTTLPPHWFGRLLAALDAEGVLVASPLDDLDATRSPLPEGAACELDAEAIDALCHLFGHREMLAWPDFSALLSVWHGERLRGIDPAQVKSRILPPLPAGLNAVLIGDLYVASHARGLRGPTPTPPGADPLPPSALGDLRASLGAALAAGIAAPPGRIGRDGKPVVLHVLHGWGGGAERFVRDLAGADGERHHLIFVARGHHERRRFGETLELAHATAALPPLRRLDPPDAIGSTSFGNASYRAFLAAILRDFRVDALLISSLIGHSLDALRTGLPTTICIHDFYPLWPVLHRDFAQDDLVFDAAQLAADLRQAGPEYPFAERDAAYWWRLREAFADAALAAGARLVAPSRAALDICLRMQPRLAALPHGVIAHGLAPWPAPLSPPAPPPRERLRLVLVGRVREGKAARLLRQLLPALSEHAELFLLGAGLDGREFFGRRDVHVVIDYARDELPALLARLAPDAALMLPDIPETFSYTLSELRSLGVPVVATRLGALAERIEEGKTGFLVAPRPAEILAMLARLRGDRGALDAVREQLARLPTRTLAEMAADYRAVLPAKPSTAAAPPPSIADPERIESATRADRLLAVQRRSDAAQTALEATTAELDRRTDWALDLEREAQIQHERSVRQQHEADRLHRELDQLHREFDERTRWAQRLDADLQAMRGSTSWKITAPLRYAMRKLRAARARAAAQRQRFASALRRTRSSLARRGLLGTLRRLGEEFARRRAGAPANRFPLESFPIPEPTETFAPFAVPASAAPQVSIVVPVYGKIAYTFACLRSLAAHAGGTAFEVLVVDDQSPDATAELLPRIDGIRVLGNAHNLGFVGSCNAGAAAARGEYVLFLNNDTVVTAGWLDALLRCFAEEPEAGLVGAKLVYPDGRLQEAGGIVFRDGSGWNYGRFGDPHDPAYEFRREADYCSGAAIMLRRELFEELGGFDARYAPAYYEDTDLAFAVRAAGRKVFYEPRSVVVHFEGVTAGTDTGAGIKRYQIVNREKFAAKWREALLRQPAPIHSPEFAAAAADFRHVKRALVVDAYTPAPDQDSGSLRMLNILRLLRELGYRVAFLPDNCAYDNRYTPALQALGVEALYRPQVDFPEWLRANGDGLDVVILSRHYVAANYLALARLYAPRAKLIFDTVDLHHLREQRAAAMENRPELARAAQATKVAELKLIGECDLTLVVSPVEKALLEREAPGAEVAVLSNVHEIHGCRKTFAERRDLVFVGGFQHPPNVDAVLWFAREAMPKLRERAPHVVLHVVGSKAPPEILELAAPNILVHGFVADIAPFMDGCRVSVAPLRVGAGVKGKVNMAMSYGLPVVATSVAVEGMHARLGEDVLVADDAEGLLAQILRVYEDEALWNALSRNGLDNVRAHFSFDAARAALRAILPK